MAAVVALCHFCEVHGPAPILVTQPHPRPAHHCLQARLRAADGGGCERCWSLGKDEVILSPDTAAKQTFVSSQAVLSKDLEPILRNAVIRAISCEVSCKREGPIVFSDPSVSTVFANNFFLKDSKARGFQRYYSIVVLTKTREHLIANLDMVESSVEKIIDNIKTKAMKTFDMESLDSKDFMDTKSHSGRRRSMAALRNLREIVGDPDIYENVHQQFVAIIQSLQNVLKEKVFSGQVMKSSVTFPRASLSLIGSIEDQLGVQRFKILLHHILAGLAVQIKSPEKILSRKIGDCLCIFLPNNLSRDQLYFANFVISGSCGESGDDLAVSTELEVGQDDTSSRHPHDDSSLLFRLMSDRCKCFDSFGTVIPGCKYCKAVSESAVISKFCKILRGRDVQDTVLELSLRTFVEMVLLQARVFSKLAQTQRSDYLRKNSYTAIDAEIFNFFKYFS